MEQTAPRLSRDPMEPPKPMGFGFMNRNAVVCFFRSLMKHAVRSGTTVLFLKVERNPEKRILRLLLEDNIREPAGEDGGTAVPARVSRQDLLRMHLSGFRHDLRTGGGSLSVRSSALGGVAVEAALTSGPSDPSLVGALIAALSDLACRHSHIDFWLRFQAGSRTRSVWLYDLARAAARADDPATDVALQASALFCETAGGDASARPKGR